MSEQKYYVKLKNEVAVEKENDYYGFDFHSHGYVYLDMDCNFYPEKTKHSFTKSELAEIMDGALYRQPFLGETGIQPEWINPIIELVPVEEE